MRFQRAAQQLIEFAGACNDMHGNLAGEFRILLSLGPWPRARGEQRGYRSLSQGSCHT